MNDAHAGWSKFGGKNEASSLYNFIDLKYCACVQLVTGFNLRLTSSVSLEPPEKRPRMLVHIRPTISFELFAELFIGVLSSESSCF